MKYIFLVMALLSTFAHSTPFDLILNQRNITDATTISRQVASPGIGHTGILLTNQFSGLPVLFKLGTSFIPDENSKTLQSASDWSNVTNRPVFSAVALSGEYQDLLNKPAASSQLNSDWNAVSGVEQILNKPLLSAVATSGDYADLSGAPSIPAAQKGRP